MRLLFFFLLTSSFSMAQSPWVRNKNAGYAQLGFSSISNYTSIYNKDAPNGTTGLERTISDRTLSVYGEFGLSNKWTLISSLPVKFLNSGELNTIQEPSIAITQSGKLTGLGNIELGAKYGFYQKKIVASAQLKVSSSSTNYDLQTGLRIGIPASAIEGLMSIGKGGANFFVFAYAGASFRSNNYSHYGRVGFEGGLDIKKRFWIIAFVDAVFSFRNGSVIASPENIQTGLYLNNQEYIAFGPKFIFEPIKEKLGITFSMGGGVSNNLVPQQLSTSFGIYYKWK